MDPPLELVNAIGISGNVASSLLLHEADDAAHIVYPLGSTLVIRNVEDASDQIFLRAHTQAISCVTMSADQTQLASGTRPAHAKCATRNGPPGWNPTVGQRSHMGFLADVIVWDISDIKAPAVLHKLSLHKVERQVDVQESRGREKDGPPLRILSSAQARRVQAATRLSRWRCSRSPSPATAPSSQRLEGKMTTTSSFGTSPRARAPAHLRSAAIQGAICTKGGVVSHLVLNEEFNDLSPSISDVLEFWVSNGTQRNKSAQLMNPNTSPQQLVPVFWVSDKQNRKGGDFAIYVGHFSPARVTAFATLVQHKKAPRRTLVELRFTRFDAEFAQKVASVSDGDGVSTKGKARVEPEVKAESSSSSGSKGNGKAKAAPAAKQHVLVEFKFRSCNTAIIDAGEWNGVLHVPMLQDPTTGRFTLAAGTTTAKGSVHRSGGRPRYNVPSPETFTATFHRAAAGQPIESFELGYDYDYYIQDEGVYTSVRPSDAKGSWINGGGGESSPFTWDSRVGLDAWERHQGGMLQAYARATIDWCEEPEDFNGCDDANVKIKLYTVLSAHKPDEGKKTKLVKWEAGSSADWDALVAVVAARNPKKSAAWSRRAVQEYRLFLELKVQAGDWDSSKFSPSTPLDEVWHVHLSFVDRYQRDILALTNGAQRVIEHSPVLGNDAYARYAAARRAHVERMGRTGGTVDKEFWPQPKESRAGFNEPHDGDSEEELDVDAAPQCG